MIFSHDDFSEELDEDFQVGMKEVFTQYDQVFRNLAER